MHAPGLTVLLGGARSGKSTLALSIAHASRRPVVFIATAEALDDDMTARIAHHRGERPATWTTVEEPSDLARALASASTEACVIVDCVTLWLTNRLLSAPAGVLDDPTGVSALGDVVQRETVTAIAAAVARSGPTIVVTNEVGLGVVPDHPLGRTFRDALGRVNAQWAAAADRSLFLVAGRAMPLVDPATLLAAPHGATWPETPRGATLPGDPRG